MRAEEAEEKLKSIPWKQVRLLDHVNVYFRCLAYMDEDGDNCLASAVAGSVAAQRRGIPENLWDDYTDAQREEVRREFYDLQIVQKMTQPSPTQDLLKRFFQS